MERFSTWRDSGTGIIPFVVPVHPAIDASPAGTVISAILYPLQLLLACLATGLFFLLLGALEGLKGLLRICLVSSTSYCSCGGRR